MKQNTTYKQTELGLIPEDWEVKKLGDLVNIKSGDSPTKFKLSESNGKYPYLKVEDLNNCNKYQSLSRNYSNDKFSIVKENSIIFPKRGAAILNNKVRINIIPVQMDSNLMALTVKNEKSNVEFLYYKITKEGLFKIADTSTIPQINNKHILPYKIPLPPLPEQKKIANCLSTWDVAIEKQSQLINALTQRKKALMQQLLTGKKRLPGFSEEWKEVKLGSLCKVTTGKLDANAMVENGIYRFYTCAKDYYLINEYKFDTEALLISGNGANVGYIHYYKGKFNAYQRTYVLDKFKEDIFFIKYFLDYFLSQRISNEKKEGNTPYIVLSTLTEMSIKLPSLSEQTAIAEILATADRELQLQKDKLAQLQSQKKGLMQVLLTGKKRLIN